MQDSKDTPAAEEKGGLPDTAGWAAGLDAANDVAPPVDAMTTYLPWTVSVLLHVGLVLLALFVVWSTVMAQQEDKIIIPTARLSATPGAPLQIKPTPRLKADPIARRTVSPLRDKTPVQLLSQPQSDATLVGVLGASGDANPFEATISGGGELRAQFLGSGGNARRIAFVIDASGSLIDTLPFVIRELKRSINQLSPRQQFTVIFYQGDDVIEVKPVGIDSKRATAMMKQQVIEQLAEDKYLVSPKGSSNPVRALRKAFTYRPQLVFLLSDAITGEGAYEIDQSRLLKEIENVNRMGTKINTIQFLYPDPLLKAGYPQGTMELIAEQSGGVYKYVSKADLNIE